MLDMIDIFLHIVIAVAAVAVAALVAPWTGPGTVWLVAVLGALAWVVREAWQNRAKRGKWFGGWSRQKTIEAVAPALAGLATAALISMT